MHRERIKHDFFLCVFFYVFWLLLCFVSSILIFAEPSSQPSIHTMATNPEFSNPLRKFKLVFLGEQSGKENAPSALSYR